ncbi:MAG: hypothetical protein U9N76_08475 [Candidatus Marinimicrobia bacterium]|nr:hypothetical protein [Candidatus Neomarinimicrobiota bacterium]
MGKSKKFIIENKGNTYYWPQDSIINGLQEVLIFNENKTKNRIPNGSVFVYQKNTPYYPDILNTDVGCGITSFITNQLFPGNPQSDLNIKVEILKVVNELNIHIGQGNHFLDFTTGHPAFDQKGIETNMIFLHSDFNNRNILPLNYDEAKDLQNIAKDKRIEFLDKLMKLLGVSGGFHHDWTHNSIEIEDDSLVYRKGAINLKKTDGVGALALNPFDGIILYAGNFSDYRFSAQHGVGRKSSKGTFLKEFKKIKHGIARGYYVEYNTEHVFELTRLCKQTYNSYDEFIDNYWLECSLIGSCVPEFVVTTKKK